MWMSYCFIVQTALAQLLLEACNRTKKSNAPLTSACRLEIHVARPGQYTSTDSVPRLPHARPLLHRRHYHDLCMSHYLFMAFRVGLANTRTPVYSYSIVCPITPWTCFGREAWGFRRSHLGIAGLKMLRRPGMPFQAEWLSDGTLGFRDTGIL